MKFFIRSGAVAWTCKLASVFALWLAFAPAPASAVPLLWTLNDVTFTGGGTANGSFRFDADTTSYSDISVMTAGGGVFSATLDFATSGGPNFLNLTDAADGPDLTGAPLLRIVFLDILTNAGGEVGLRLNSISSGAVSCANADCSNFFSSDQSLFASGSVISEAVAQVSEPGTLALFAGPLLAFVLVRRRSVSSRTFRRAVQQPA